MLCIIVIVECPHVHRVVHYKIIRTYHIFFLLLAASLRVIYNFNSQHGKTLTREHCSRYFDTHQVEQHRAGIDTERDIEKHKEKRWQAEICLTLLRLHPLLFAYLILRSWMSESVIYLWSHWVLDEKWICLALKQDWYFVLYHTAHCFAPWLVFNFTHYVLKGNCHLVKSWLQVCISISSMMLKLTKARHRYVTLCLQES